MTTTTEITEIEKLTRDYASKRAVVSTRVTALEEETRSLTRRKLPGIKAAVASAQDARDKLASAIDQNREQFHKPKTISIEGIRVGLKKSKGKIEWADAEKVVTLIRKKLSDQFDVLVLTKETPIKSALNNLSVAELKTIGCEIKGAGDQVLIKPQDSEIDKLVDKLMGDIEDVEEAGS